MSQLPPGFPTTLSEPDRYRILGFYRRFVQEYYREYKFGHFLFAGYASIPALLTPDLLYQLWQNFHDYRWNDAPASVHRIAVADLLLSGLCHEVGFELYEMLPGVRLAFQEWLNRESGRQPWAGNGLRRPEQVAAFVGEYHRKPNPGELRWGPGYTETQKWSSLTIIDHAQLQNILIERLKKAVEKEEETEALRIKTIFQQSAQQLVRLYRNDPRKNIDNFVQNARMAEAWKNLVQQDTGAFLKQVTENARLHTLLKSGAEAREGDIPFDVPAGVGAQINRLEPPKIRGLLIGIDLYKYTDPLSGCAHDIELFHAFLSDFEKRQNRKVETTILLNENATLGATIDAFDQIKNAQEGDLCIFYFSGKANSMKMEINQGRQLILHDSQPGSSDDKLIQGWIEKQLYDIVSKKAVHVVLIFDTEEVREEAYKKELQKQPLRLNTQQLAGSVVILNAAQVGQQAGEYPLGDKKGGLFSNVLLEILKDGGTGLSYQSIMHRARVRLLQSQPRQSPYLEAFPPYAANLLFLSDQLDSQVTYPVAFHPATQEWRLLAGATQGINPSLNFMHTYLRLREMPNRKMSVKSVFTDYSTFFDFESEERHRTFTAVLAQNALPKVKVAFDAGMDKHLQRQFLDAVDRYDLYYIDLTDDLIHAHYLIRNRTEEFYLVRNAPGPEINDIPVFNFEKDPFEFIKQMEYIAQWTGVLEYNRTSLNINKEDLEIKFEKIEAQRINPDTLNDLQGKDAGYSDPLELRFIREDGKWLQPAFRCILGSKQSKMFASVVFLDSRYGIQLLDEIELPELKNWRTIGLEEKKGSNWVQVRMQSGNRYYNAIPLTLDKHLLNSEVNEFYDFLKIFISDKPLDLTPLLQNSLKFDQEATRSAGFESGRATFDASGVDWTSITVPIRLIKETRSVETPAPSSLEQILVSKTNVPLNELFNSTQYADVLQEIQTRLCDAGLLDPVIGGDELKPFGPVGKTGSQGDEFKAALEEFCTLASLKFDGQSLTLEISEALLHLESTQFLPVQFADRPDDAAPTRLAKRILRYMREKGYWIARSPNTLNIIYVEGINEDGTPNDNKFNEWNDRRIVIRIAPGGIPELEINHLCTTEPGSYYTQNPIKPEGAAHIAFGQYKAWADGLHKGKAPALVQKGPVRIYRDAQKMGRRNAADPVEITGSLGLNQHGSGRNEALKFVDKYSACALVGHSEEQHLRFLDTVRQDQRYTRNKNYFFMTTIIPGAELEKEKNISQNEPAKSGIDKQTQIPVQIQEKVLPAWPPYSYGEKPASLLWHLGDDFSQLASARDRVWEALRKGSIENIRIAHIDVGYDPSHPAFKDNPNIRHDLARSLVNGEEQNHAINFEAEKSDNKGHGTAMLSMLSGWELQGNGYLGAIPFAETIPLRISDSVVLLSGDTLDQAIDIAIDTGCEVICCAMAGKTDNIIAKAINRAYEKGIVMVFAAGNNYEVGLVESNLPGSVHYPARYYRTIAACGVCYNHFPFDFEAQEKYAHVKNKFKHKSREDSAQGNWGPPEAMLYALAGYTANVVWADEVNRNLRTNGSGTSTATAQIAAAAALWIMMHKNELKEKGYAGNWRQVEATRFALFTAAEKSFQEYKKYFGNGILKAMDALQIPCPDVPDDLMAPEAESSFWGINEIFNSFFGKR